MADWTRPNVKYLEMVESHGQVAGYKKGGWPILKRHDHPEQWREWYAYYSWRGMKWHASFMEERDEKTVPTLSPCNFDAEFNPVQLRPVPRKHADGAPSPEARARAARIYAAFSGRSDGYQQAAE